MTVHSIRISRLASFGTHRLSHREGFSLVECILSVAITVTSLLSVIGMLAGTLGIARDCKQETISGVLIRQLAGEIKELPKQATPDSDPEPLIVVVDEGMKIVHHSLYDGNEIAAMYELGTLDANAASFARIDRFPDPEDPLMDRVVIRVESPASAPSARREVRRYAALSPK